MGEIEREAGRLAADLYLSEDAWEESGAASELLTEWKAAATAGLVEEFRRARDAGAQDRCPPLFVGASDDQLEAWALGDVGNSDLSGRWEPGEARVTYRLSAWDEREFESCGSAPTASRLADPERWLARARAWRTGEG